MFTQGVNGHVKMSDCKASNDKKNHVYSILRWAQLAGKSTGIVTNTRITHATPASAYAHCSNRLHESDKDVRVLGGSVEDCVDVARQFIETETGKNLDVALGGGRIKFMPNTTVDEYGNRGEREDHRNLIDEWIKYKSNNRTGSRSYVSNRESMMKLDHKNVNSLLGLFATGHMDYHSDANQTVEPSLLEMTEMAMKVLSNNPEGYVLFVEGGLIDYANHKTFAQKALIETCVLSKTVEMADKATSESDTLIVVTSDHSHTMTHSGYPNRGHNILGTTNSINEGVNPDGKLFFENITIPDEIFKHYFSRKKTHKFHFDFFSYKSVADKFDNKSVTVISYAYGPGYVNNRDEHGKRIDLDKVKMGYYQFTMINLAENHDINRNHFLFHR